MAARLSRYLAGRLTVRPQQTQPLGHGGTVRIRPDLIFERPAGTAVYVADTKYKITADGYARDADYYQILAYTRALDVPGRHADLLPARRRRPARAITVGAHQTASTPGP